MPKKYEDLTVFKRARVLVKDVYTATATFPASEHYGLVSQMRRAAISVLSNVAESQGRLTHGESRQLLSQARGSLYEVEAQVLLAEDLGYVTPERAEILRTHVRGVAKPLSGFIRWTQHCEAEAKTNRRLPPVNRRPISEAAPSPPASSL